MLNAMAPRPMDNPFHEVPNEKRLVPHWPDLPPDPPDDDYVCPHCGQSARTHRDGECQV
jgi:hypothetical protein